MTDCPDIKLFEGVGGQDCLHMLGCMNARRRSFYAEEEIFAFDGGKKIVGIILDGSASVVRYGKDGTRSILENLETKSIFGENISFVQNGDACIAVVSKSDCSVLFMDYEVLTHPCHNACACHTQLIRNLMQLLSEKTRALSERVEVLSRRSTRDKLMCYFMQISSRTGADTFEIPFTMMDLADFLSVNRSAMVRELGKMKEEGLLRLEKRVVTLL